MRTATATANFRRNLRTITDRTGVIALAKRAGITPVYLYRILAGGCNPSIEVSLRLAEASGVPLADLLGRKKICG